MFADEQEIRVTDLAACAYLLTAGCRLARLEATAESGRFAFVVVGDGSRIQRELAAFVSRTATVDLRRFLSRQRRLRALVHRRLQVPEGERGHAFAPTGAEATREGAAAGSEPRRLKAVLHGAD